MNYTQFKEEIQKRITAFLPDRFRGYHVEIKPVVKNNGVLKDRLIIRGNELMPPPIYLKEYFDCYKDGETLEYVLGKITDAYERDYDAAREFGIEILQYENVKEHLTVAACNAEMNVELLKNTPHEIREDLALVYHIRQQHRKGETKTVLVDNQLLELWKIGAETLKEDAWKSMKTENMPCFRSIQEILGGLFRSEGLSRDLYVLTNQDEMLGAAYMFDTDTMGGIAEKLGKSLIVLPSSIHETIIIPEGNDVEVEEMQMMVKSINGTELEPEDILSNQVYHFDKDTQELSIMASPQQTMGMGMNM